MTPFVLCFGLCAGGVLGCTDPEAPVAPATTATEAAATPTPATPSAGMGTLVGRVRLAEDLELPRYTLEQIGREEGRPAWPDSCTAPAEGDRQPMRLSRAADGTEGVEGVMVTATGEREAFFAAVGEHEPTTHTVAIEDCRLTPSLLVAVRGDTLRIENRTNHAFLPAFSAQGFMEGIAGGDHREHPIERRGVHRVNCGFAAGCGMTEVVVLAHDVATVTREAGTFELQVPAGIEIQLHAWHPLFGRSEGRATATVQAGERVEVDVLIEQRGTPPRPAAPTMAPATPEGRTLQ